MVIRRGWPRADSRELFNRYPGNPLLTSKDLPYRANTIFNAGAVHYGEDVLLLMRVEDRRGFSHFTLARSRDGVTDWRIENRPILVPQPDTHPEERWGIEDPRITYLDKIGKYIVAYTAYSESGASVALATTTDFRIFSRLGVVLPPENKDAALFPEKINGKWAMLHRPSSGMSNTNMWIAFSKDLVHWGENRLLLSARTGWWDAHKIGLSPPPLKTEQGWLIMYHGVKKTAGGIIYRIGLALLDLENPRIVRARSSEWVMQPEEDYENFGDVDKVVFPCGWIVNENRIRLYYGAGDKCIALAEADLKEVISWLSE